MIGNGAGSIYCDLTFQGAQTLGGTGTIVFGGGNLYNNRLDTASSGGDSGTLTIGSGITIEGQSGSIEPDSGGAYPLILQGTIDDNVSGGEIQVDGTNWSNLGAIAATSGGSVFAQGTWTDNSVVSADSTSTVYLGGTFSVGSGASFTGTGTVAVAGTLDNSGTTLTLDDSALTFEMGGGAIDSGDIVTTNGAALFGSGYGGTLEGVTLDGTLDMATFNSQLAVTGGLTLSNGSILMGSAGLTYSYLTFQGAQTLGGTGTVVFDGTLNTDEIITASSGGDSGKLTIGSGITIEGQSGYIGFNFGGTEYPLILQGIVDDNVSGGQIQVDGTNWSNLGTITATSGGSVFAEGTWTDNSVVSADSTSTVYLGGTFSVGSSASFTGTGTVAVSGTLDNSGSTLTLDDSALTFEMDGGEIDSGDIVTTNGAALFGTGGTLAGVTLDGTLDMATYSSVLAVTGGLTLSNGSILIGNGSGSSGDLTFQGAQTLGGTGTVIFGGGNAYNNRLDTASSGGDSGTLTIGSGITIEGQNGFIGLDGGGTEYPMILEGTIDDNVSGGQIQVLGSNWTNSGTITATSGGSVFAQGTWTDNSVVSADSTSTVYLGGTFSVGSSASFTGTGTVAVSGTLDNSGSTLTLDDSALTFEMDGGEIDSGDIVTTNGAALFGTGGTLAGVTLDGTLDMATYSSVLAVTGGLTLSNGSILIGNGSGSSGDLTFQGAQTLGGTGTVIFGGGSAYNNRLDTASSGGDSGTLTIGSGITIEGQNGFIGLDGGGTEYPMILEGTIDDNVSGGLIRIFGTNLTNSGTLEATGGGTLDLTGTNLTNSGTIEAAGDGEFDIYPTNWTNSGTIAATTGGVGYLEGSFTDPGAVSVDATSRIYLDGTVSVDSGSSFAGAGAVNLRGTLDNTGETLTLNDPGLAFMLDGGAIDGGTVETTGGAALVATNPGGTLAGVTLDGTLDMTVAYPTLDVTGGLTLDDGTIDLGSQVAGGTFGTLTFQGAQTLGGSGSVVFGSDGDNYIDTESSGGDSGTLTIGPNITIDGTAGSIGSDGGGTETPLVLEGTIDANSSASYIQIYGTNWTNSGTIEATAAGAQLGLNGTNWTNSGAIEAANGGIVTATSSNWTNSGTIEATAAGSQLGLNGTTGTNSGTIEATGGSSLGLTGTDLTNSSTIEATGGATLDVSPTNWTNAGTIEATTGSTAYLENSFIDPGVISVDSTSQIYLDGTFSVDSGSSFAGTGVMYLRGTLDNTGETLTLDDSGLAFMLDGGAIDGGTVETTGGATLIAPNSAGTLAGVTLDGTLDMTGAYSTLDVTGSLTLDDGTIDLGSQVAGGTFARSHSRAHRPWAAPARSSLAPTATTSSTPNPVAATPAPSRSGPTSRSTGLRASSGMTAVAPRPRWSSRARSTRTSAGAPYVSTAPTGSTQARSKPATAAPCTLKATGQAQAQSKPAAAAPATSRVTGPMTAPSTRIRRPPSISMAPSPSNPAPHSPVPALSISRALSTTPARL